MGVAWAWAFSPQQSIDQEQVVLRPLHHADRLAGVLQAVALLDMQFQVAMRRRRPVAVPRKPMRRSSSPTRRPARSVAACASASVSAPAWTAAPIRPGANRAPSSLVQFTTTTGWRVTDAGAVQRADAFQGGEHAERAVELAAGLLRVQVAAEQHGRQGGLGALAPGEHVAHRVDGDGR